MIIGTVVEGKYSVIRQIGRGSMGVVYLAKDLFLDRDVALKVMPANLATSSAIERFRKEAKALAAIRNEHVVQVYSFGVNESLPYFAMEFVQGRDLGDLIAEHAAHGSFIPIPRGLTILRQVASGLGAVHAASLLHRDVKPGNIVIEERTGRPVLIDFGLAGREEGGSTDIVGTPAYMAPEQASGAALSDATDIYSLGCTAYELLCGRPPFDAETMAAMFQLHQSAAPAALSLLRPGTEMLNSVMNRALAKDPLARYASCESFVQALKAAERVLLNPAVTLPPPPPDPVVDPELVRIEGARGAPLEVLIVDDEPAFRRYATRCVQLAFYQQPLRVRIAGSGSQGIAAAEQRMPDLIVLDHTMRGLDGVETLALLRDLPDGARARVVVISATTGNIEKWRFGVLGVQDFIDKSVPFAALVEMLTEIGRSAGWARPAAS